jgi:hypothetical protein
LAVDSLQPLWLLPSRRRQPRSRRTAEKGDERPPLQLVELHPIPKGLDRDARIPEVAGISQGA